MTTTVADLDPTARADLFRRARERAGVSGVPDDGPRPRPAGTVPPATSVQQQLHYLHAVAPNVPNYTTAFALELTGPLDSGRLEAALNRVVAGHEALRTRLARVDGRLVQEIDPPGSVVAVDLPVHDYSEFGGAGIDPVQEGWALAEAKARTPIDPTRGPLWRVALAVLNAEHTHHLLIWAASHSIFDGVSMGLMAGELATYYNQPDAENPTEPLTLGDVAVWEQDRLTGSRGDELRRFWRAELDGLPALDLPLDRPRPARPVLAGEELLTPLDDELLAGLDAVAARAGTTRFTVMLAAYATVMSGLAGALDVPVGVPLDGRPRPALAEVVGCLMTTVVVRAKLRDDESFHDLTTRLRDTVANALEHQDLSLGQVVADLRPDREGATAPPLVQTIFNYAGLPAAAKPIAFTEELTARLHGLSNHASRFDVELSVDATASGTRLRLEYATAVLDRTSAEEITQAYLTTLRTIIRDDETPLSALRPARRKRLAPAEVPSSTDHAVIGRSSPEKSSPDSGTGTLEIVAGLWAEALGLPEIELDADFFALGGSSLLATELVERIQERTGVAVPLIDLLTAPSVRDVAALIEESSS